MVHVALWRVLRSELQAAGGRTLPDRGCVTKVLAVLNFGRGLLAADAQEIMSVDLRNPIGVCTEDPVYSIRLGGPSSTCNIGRSGMHILDHL